jgi:hypothetical protein
MVIQITVNLIVANYSFYLQHNIIFYSQLVKYYLLSSSASTFSELFFVKLTGLVHKLMIHCIVVRFPVQSLSNFQNLA